MLSALREAQVPLLAILLIGGCVTKARRAICSRSADAGIGPTTLFPLRLRRPLMIALCITEMSLGIALLATASPFAAGAPAMIVRALTTLLFMTAMGSMHVLRAYHPEAGCGCFGEASRTPVGWRVLARAALLALAALGTVTAGPLRGLTSPNGGRVLLEILAAEVAVLAALSPEIGEVMMRLGYREPCELRRIPVTRTLASLRGGAQWRRYRRYLTATEPDDVWREGCWRYAVFPAVADGRPADVVFAVYMRLRRPAVVAAIIDAGTDQPLPDPVVPVQRPSSLSSANLYSSIKKSQY
ncbi:MAG: methylamine utilization protein MauD [Nocardiopsaceae bacterium]|nr:methylamine utilization protein MauD [Nocardiopsaceae bacterium]